MLADYFIPTAQGLDCVENWWFMQDEARPHRTSDVFDLLEEHFDHRLIALDRRLEGGLEWAPYSPNLNPCDYFYGGA